MAPKTHFTFPLKKAGDAVAPTPCGRQATHTSEKIPLDHSSKQKASSKASGSRCQETNNEAQTNPSNETMETYPLHFIEPQDDAKDLGDVGECDPPSNVSVMWPFQFAPSIII